MTSASPSDAPEASPTPDGGLEQRLLRELSQSVRELPDSLQGGLLRGIRSEDLLRLVEHALQPEREEFARERDQLVSQIEGLRQEREQLLAANDETRRYELPRLAALVEVERNRSEELEQEVQSLEAQLESLQNELEARRDQVLRHRKADGERSEAEQLLLDLDQRLHRLEEGHEGDEPGDEQGAGEAGEGQADDQALALMLEQYAEAELRGERIAELEAMVAALANGEAPEQRAELASLRQAERASSRTVLQLVREALSRQVRQESRHDELLQTLRRTQEVLAAEVQHRRELEERLVQAEQRTRLGSGQVPWPLPRGSTTRELNQVLDALRGESERRELESRHQIQRLGQATRAALERMADLLDQVIHAGRLADGEGLTEAELEGLFEAAHRTEQAAGGDPAPPAEAGNDHSGARPRFRLLDPSELEPDPDPEPEDLYPDSGGELQPELEPPPTWRPEQGGPRPEAEGWELGPPSDSLQGAVARALGQARGLQDGEPGRPSARRTDSFSPGDDWLAGLAAGLEDEGDEDESSHGYEEEDSSADYYYDSEDDELEDGPAYATQAGPAHVTGLGELPDEGFDPQAPLSDPPSFSSPHEDSPLDAEEQAAALTAPAAGDDADWLAEEGGDEPPPEPALAAPPPPAPLPEAPPAPDLGGHDETRTWDRSPLEEEAFRADAPTKRAEPLPGDQVFDAEEFLVTKELPSDLKRELLDAQNAEDESTRRLARGLIEAMRKEESLRVERDRLEDKARDAEKALESEVWRGLATHRELVAARQRLNDLEGKLNDQLRRVRELEQVPSLRRQAEQEARNLAAEIEAFRPTGGDDTRESIVHWLLLEGDEEWRASKSKAIRACRRSLERIRQEGGAAEDLEKLEEMLHWLSAELPGEEQDGVKTAAGEGGDGQPASGQAPLDF